MSENLNPAELQKTCLYDRHVALQAKMSPFAGFMMPIQYDSITVEHNAVRQKVGMFDVSHMGEVFVEGPEAEKFVNWIFTNEIRGFEPGKVLYGMMCYPDGGVVDDLLVYREFAPEHFLLVGQGFRLQGPQRVARLGPDRRPGTRVGEGPGRCARPPGSRQSGLLHLL